jgi:hypothetical protein
MMFLAQCRSNELDRFVGAARQNGATCVESFAAVDGEDALLILEGTREIKNQPSIAPVTQLFGGGSVGGSGGDHLFKVGIWVPPASRAEFLDWYESEHLPILLECPTWNGCRFVEKQVPDGHQFYALHQLESPSALDSEERRRSRSTPWFMHLKQNPWFDESFTRQLYTRVGT